jgi:hypothetical protein
MSEKVMYGTLCVPAPQVLSMNTGIGASRTQCAFFPISLPANQFSPYARRLPRPYSALSAPAKLARNRE